LQISLVPITYVLIHQLASSQFATPRLATCVQQVKRVCLGVLITPGLQKGKAAEWLRLVRGSGYEIFGNVMPRRKIGGRGKARETVRAAWGSREGLLHLCMGSLEELPDNKLLDKNFGLSN
jgi:hypothetical protein